METNETFLVPRTNLAESVHGSWLASNDGVHYISLYNACQGDLITTLLQQSKYDSFLKGGHKGCGPGIQKIKKREASMSSMPFGASNIIDISNEAATELNATKRRLSADGDARIVRRKQRGSIHTPIKDGDSHRPEYEYVTQRVRQPKPSQREQQKGSRNEIDIHPTRWAIRRTNPGSEVRCQGYLRNNKKKCNELIDKKGRVGLLGVPAPCFQGLVQVASGIEKIQYVWFCGNDIDHTREPSNIVLERPATRPTIWPIAKGTCLDSNEMDALWVAGFDLHDFELQQESSERKDKEPMHGLRNYNDKMDVRPLQRDGKPVVVFRVVTKQMEERIKRAIEMTCTIHDCKVWVPNEHVGFIVSTAESQAQGKTYSVVISEFPSCTCEDFQMRVRGGKRYMACKHLYFVFIKHLEMDVHQQKFVHQAALTKRELHQALRLVY